MTSHSPSATRAKQESPPQMMPFIDLAAQQARIKPEIDAAIQRVLAHGQYIMGPEVKLLEQQLCEFVGSKHCITVSNGTDALIAALMALEIGPGDGVITTPFTFFATVEAIMMVGATPIFADIDSTTFNICPNEIEQAIKRTRAENKLQLKAVMPVDLFGLCANYSAITALAEEHGLIVIQDAAQSFGASTPDGRRAPTHGLIGTASFFPAKPLGCYGDGGACFTDDDELAGLLRSIRVHGKGVDKYDNVRVGQNCRMDTIQAAILIEKLKIYEDELEKRQQVAVRYDDGLASIESIRTPEIPEGYRSAWAQYTIRSDKRDELSEKLKAAGIPTVVYYRTPAHLLGACSRLDLKLGDFQVSEVTSATVLSLPFSPLLEDSVVGDITKAMELFKT